MEQLGEINTTEQVCKYLHIGRGLLYEEMKDGKITAFKTGRSYRFTKQAVLDYIKRMEVKPQDVSLVEEDQKGDNHGKEENTSPAE